MHPLMEKLAMVTPDIFKWIDDAMAIMRYGTGHKIEWYKPHTGAQVETLLGRYGVSVYWRDYGHGKNTRGLHVPKAQAKWADYVLRRAGAPLASPALSRVTPGPMPAEWGVPARPVGLAGMIVRSWIPLERRQKRQRRR